MATHQLHLIQTAQLYACGIGRSAIARRRRRGLLHPVHHGVFLFGTPTLLSGARELAAVLAVGGSSVVSSRSSTALYGLTAPPAGDVELTLAGDAGRKRAGITIHRVSKLDPRDVTHLRGIPIVTPARAILDLAASTTGDELERAIAEAYALRLTTEAELYRVIARNPLKAGVQTSGPN